MTAHRALAIIPCLNEAAHIHGLIARLLDDPDWIDPLIVVADGGSTDGTREIVSSISRRDARVLLLANPGKIQSAGVNLAARTRGEGRRWMVRVDAHASYPRGYVSALVREAERTGAASVVVCMKTRGRGCFQRAAAAAQNSKLGTGGAAHRATSEASWVDHGHHALFDLQAFLAVGGYDETFSHNEDAELDVRLGQGGYRIWLTREVEITYFPRDNPAALFRQYVSYGAGRARTILKHRMKPKLRQLLPLGVAPAVLLALLGSAFTPLAALPALLWAGLCLAFGAAIGWRAQSRCAAASGAAAMIMHLGWSIGFWRQLLAGRSSVGAARGQPQPVRS